MGIYTDLLFSKQADKEQPRDPLESIVPAKPPIEKAKKKPQSPSSKKSEKSKAQPPLERKIKRHTYYYYSDQINRIKQLQLDAEIAGKKTLVSEFVRQALDEFLQKK